jgi:hypothetical protein
LFEMKTKSTKRKPGSSSNEIRIPDRHYRHNDSETPDTDNLDETRQQTDNIDPVDHEDSVTAARKIQDDDE